jgi:hypothetical protein
MPIGQAVGIWTRMERFRALSLPAGETVAVPVELPDWRLYRVAS